MSKEIKSNQKIIVLAFLLILAILSIVIVLRLVQGKPALPRGESYYNIRMAQALNPQPFISKDPVQGTPYEPNSYHYLLALLLAVLPIEVVIIALPILLGLISAFLFFKILIMIGITEERAAYALIILAVTPVFVVLFTGLYSSALVVLLSLLLIFIIIKAKKSKFELVLCILLFFLLALTSLMGFLLTLLLIFSLCQVLKRKLNLLFIPLVPSVIAFAFLSILYKYTPRLLGFHGFAFRNILSILRAENGFDIFLLVLFFFGFFVSWARNEQRRLFHLAVLGLFSLSLFNDSALIFVSFITAIYCVNAIFYLYQRKWELEIIRTGTLLLVLCGLVFSITSQANLLVKAQPGQEIEKALISLKEKDRGSVLTAEENGFLVEFYSGDKVLLDSNSFLYPEYGEYSNVSDKLFKMARLKDAEPLFKQYELRYVLITPEMKDRIWGGRDQGLWLLVQNSESFDRIYSNRGVSIWEYKPSEETSQAQPSQNISAIPV
jgi:hypothetical protein